MSVSERISPGSHPERFFSPEMPNNNSAMAHLLDWRAGNLDAQWSGGELEKRLPKFRAAGLTSQIAEAWADFYEAVARKSATNPSAPAREKIFKELTELLRNPEQGLDSLQNTPLEQIEYSVGSAKSGVMHVRKYENQAIEIQFWHIDRNEPRGQEIINHAVESYNNSSDNQGRPQITVEYNEANESKVLLRGGEVQAMGFIEALKRRMQAEAVEGQRVEFKGDLERVVQDSRPRTLAEHIERRKNQGFEFKYEDNKHILIPPTDTARGRYTTRHDGARVPGPGEFTRIAKAAVSLAYSAKEEIVLRYMGTDIPVAPGPEPYLDNRDATVEHIIPKIEAAYQGYLKDRLKKTEIKPGRKESTPGSSGYVI